MFNLKTVIQSIPAVDIELAQKAQQLLDQKTKPLRSLGRLEELACRYCAARGTLEPSLPQKAIVVMAADHGVAQQGVSAYPQQVTQQMVRNFAEGGAAINALAKQVGAELIVVDMGVVEPVQTTDKVHVHRIAAGTRNFMKEPAMSAEQALQAICVGVDIAMECVRAGVTLLGIGEMGIANTTSASAVLAVLTGAPVSSVTGRGTGIDDAAWVNKQEVIECALRVNHPDPKDPLDVLAKLGGFEIAGLVGVIIGASSKRVPVMVDGFITGAAALVAHRLAPRVKDYLIASHRSVEVGHDRLLKELDLSPLFDFDMRLGEASGAALAMNFVDAAIYIMNDMATFAQAGVSEREDE